LGQTRTLMRSSSVVRLLTGRSYEKRGNTSRS
jgi:hypothetical protein